MDHPNTHAGFMVRDGMGCPDNWAMLYLPVYFFRTILVTTLTLLGTAFAQETHPLPAAARTALARTQVPPEALTALVVEVQGDARPRLAWQVNAAVNPASVMKLVTTYAALDLLGPAFTWDTPVYLDGVPQGGTLRGNVYIQGRGDPKMVVERLWLLLRRLRAQGITKIDGDMVLDRSAFQVAAHDAALFDGEPWRPYNAAPDALLLNFNAVVMDFVPDAAAGVARVQYTPPLAGIHLPATVPLLAANTTAGKTCGDWRSTLAAHFADASRITFAGKYPQACGARQWAAALAEPRRFAARAIAGMWHHLGGQLGGVVREGQVPNGLPEAFQVSSPTLAEVVRDINKYSNNVMAQQVFLTLGLQSAESGSPVTARAAVAQWWSQRVGADVPLVIDNGSGLSREARITALGLARMLRSAWASPVMPDLLASLPIAGVDGTLRRSQSRVARGKGKTGAAAAHLKTGTLRDVTAMAGYVHAASGKRYVLVAIINHPNAAAARPALEALVDWAAEDR